MTVSNDVLAVEIAWLKLLFERGKRHSITCCTSKRCDNAGDLSVCWPNLSI